jgi:hypothetical protein
MQRVVGVLQASSLVACKLYLMYHNQLAASMVIQIPTSATTHYRHNEPLLLSTVDRKCQFNHTNHTLSKVVLFIMAIHLAKPATQVLVLISQAHMVRYLSNLDPMVNQLNRWAAPCLVSHSLSRYSFPTTW